VAVVVAEPRGAVCEATSGKAGDAERARVTAEAGAGREEVGECSKSQLGIVEGVAVYSVSDVLGVSYSATPSDLGV
jgi:hypothetical protein